MASDAGDAFARRRRDLPTFMHHLHLLLSFCNLLFVLMLCNYPQNPNFSSPLVLSSNVLKFCIKGGNPLWTHPPLSVTSLKKEEEYPCKPSSAFNIKSETSFRSLISGHYVTLVDHRPYRVSANLGLVFKTAEGPTLTHKPSSTSVPSVTTPWRYVSLGLLLAPKPQTPAKIVSDPIIYSLPLLLKPLRLNTIDPTKGELGFLLMDLFLLGPLSSLHWPIYRGLSPLPIKPRSNQKLDLPYPLLLICHNVIYGQRLRSMFAAKLVQGLPDDLFQRELQALLWLLTRFGLNSSLPHPSQLLCNLMVSFVRRLHLDHKSPIFLGWLKSYLKTRLLELSRYVTLKDDSLKELGIMIPPIWSGGYRCSNNPFSSPPLCTETYTLQSINFMKCHPKSLKNSGIMTSIPWSDGYRNLFKQVPSKPRTETTLLSTEKQSTLTHARIPDKALPSVDTLIPVISSALALSTPLCLRVKTVVIFSSMAMPVEDASLLLDLTSSKLLVSNWLTALKSVVSIITIYLCMFIAFDSREFPCMFLNNPISYVWLFLL